MDIRNALGAALLAFAAAATWYWSRPPAPAPAEPIAEDAAPLGYYVTGARLLRADDTGNVAYTIVAARAEELPDQQELEMSDVLIEYRPEDRIAWQISATRARALMDGEYLELSGEVELRSKPTEGAPLTVIVTDRLNLEPNRYIARSDSAVDIVIGENRLRAVGLKAHLKEDRLELESEVHGQFPSSP